MLKVLVAGASGKMGLAIIRELQENDALTLVGALVSKTSKFIGQDAGKLAGIAKLDIPVTDHLENLDFDIMIDFSSTYGVERHLELCMAHNAAILIGTTGLNELQNKLVSDASNRIPVLFAANTSVGVNLCVALVEMATRVLGDKADIEIIEAHHKHKVDAPSGTALLLGEAAANAADKDLGACSVYSREGHTGARQAGSIGFSTIRGGNIAGEHTVMFISENERIEITHRATDRKIFAQGAVRGAGWLAQQQKGLFSMQDVLDLR